jgi:threonine dehydratase
VGGVGLIAGLAVALKKLNPRVKVIGVQAEKLPSMKAALERGAVVHLPPATTIADGIAVRAVGELPLEIARNRVDQIVTVSEGEIANSVLLLLEIEKTVAEGAAAVSLAALVNGKTDLRAKQVAVVVTGGNIDVNLIARIIEKGLIQEGRLARLSVIIPDRPGSLARLTQTIGQQEANTLQLEHVRGFGEIAIGETEVDFILETTGPEHIRRLESAIQEEGFQIRPKS